MANQAYEEGLKKLNMPAATDLSASQYCFCTMNGSGQVAVTGDGLKADGVLQDGQSVQGSPSQVAVAGVSRLRLGAGVTAGMYLASDSTGRGVQAGTGDKIMGRAMADGSADSVGCILLQVQGSN